MNKAQYKLYSLYTTNIKCLVLTHIRLPQLKPPVAENVQLHESQARSLRSAFFDTGIEMGRYKICVTNCLTGSFFSSEIGEIGWESDPLVAHCN